MAGIRRRAFPTASWILLLVAACSTPPVATPSAPAATPGPTTTAGGPTPTPAGEPGETLVVGTIRTADDANPTAEAILVRGDGIVLVGTAEEARAQAGASATVIELPFGMVVTPGFIDSHEHRIGDQGFDGSGAAPELIDDAIAEGWTSINELFTDQSRLGNLDAMDAAGLLRLRVNAYLPLHSPQADSYGTWYSAYEAKSDRSSRLRLAGVKIFMDHGWGIGELMHSQADLDRMVADAHAAGWQVAVHTVGDEALTSILDALAAAGIGPEDRPRIEHVIAASDANIERMREGGAIASIQLNLPGYAIDAPDWQAEIIPPGHADMFRYRDLAEAGLRVAGSSDWPWITREAGGSAPLGLLYQAVTRRTLGGRAPEPWMVGQELTLEQAFRSLTIDGAFATFEEDRKGSLAAGKLADLVILSADPLDAEVADLLGIQVIATMIGGRIEHCAVGFEDLCPVTLTRDFSGTPPEPQG